MFNMYLFLKRSRFHKKWQVYKKIWDLSADITLFFYTGLMLAYIVYILVVEQNVFQTMQQQIPAFQTIHPKETSLLIMVLPFVYWFQSFQQPGVLFTTAEWKLTTLTYHSRHIWRMLAIERSMIALGRFSLIGLVYFLFSSSVWYHILFYIFILWVMNGMMTIIQWKLFQQSIWIKFSTGLFWLLVVASSLVFPWHVVLTFGLALVLTAQIIGYRRIFHKIDWDNVRMAADYKVWNLPFVSRVTKVSIKKERKRVQWQHRIFWKKPFSFQKSTMYHRLWYLHITKNFKYIGQMVGVLLLLNIVLGLLKDWLFTAAILITIHIWSQFLSVLFKDRFSVDILELLPWNLAIFQRSYLKWGYSLTSVLFLPLMLWLIFSFSYWNVLFLMVTTGAFFLYFNIQLFAAQERLVKRVPVYKGMDLIGYGVLISLMVSYFWNIALCFGLLLLILGSIRRKRV